MMCRWTVRGASRLELPGAKPRAAHFADRSAYDHGVRNWLLGFLDHWTELAKPRAEAPKKLARSAARDLGRNAPELSLL